MGRLCGGGYDDGQGGAGLGTLEPGLPARPAGCGQVLEGLPCRAPPANPDGPPPRGTAGAMCGGRPGPVALRGSLLRPRQVPDPADLSGRRAHRPDREPAHRKGRERSARHREGAKGGAPDPLSHILTHKRLLKKPQMRGRNPEGDGGVRSWYVEEAEGRERSTWGFFSSLSP